MTEELIVRREGVAGFLTLNRPKAIHALTAPMDHAMTEALLGGKATIAPLLRELGIEVLEGGGEEEGGEARAAGAGDAATGAAAGAGAAIAA